jgi:predicted transposase/invertase (TIGR01784 family)
MPQRYLDPKNDIVFKRIFGEHPHILRSFLNALLPLTEDEKIVSLEYLPAEQVPQVPTLKNSIVDVRCKDKHGRQFIVEMQINWTSSFLQRVLFNASKAYVRQLEKREEYVLLQPVMGLAVLDDTFDRETAEFYHHYKMVNVQQTSRVIEGLQLVFIELPKFKPETMPKDNPHKQAWLRFLKEAGEEQSSTLMTELGKQVPEINEAYELAIESTFSKAELESYDRYWDIVRTEKTLIMDKLAEGRKEGEAKGLARGRAEGLEEGRAAERAELRAKLQATGMSATQIDDMLGK